MRNEFERQAGNKRGRPRHYCVRLTADERGRLKALALDPNNKLQQRRAAVLLALDEGEQASQKRIPYDQISEECLVHVTTVSSIARRFQEGGIEAVIAAQQTGSPITAEEEDLLLKLTKEANGASKPPSVRQLARAIGRSPAAVSKKLKQLGSEGKRGPEPSS